MPAAGPRPRRGRPAARRLPPVPRAGRGADGASRLHGRAAPARISERSCCRPRWRESTRPRTRAGGRLGGRGELKPLRRLSLAARRRRFPHVCQIDEMDCGAACLAMVCRATSAGRSRLPADPPARPHLDRRHEPAGDRARRRGARPRRARRQGVARRRSTSCRCRRSSTGRATTGSCSTTSARPRRGSPTRRSGSAAVTREEFDEKWSRLRGALRLHRRSRRSPVAARRHRAGCWPFFRPLPARHRWRAGARARRGRARRCCSRSSPR